MESRSAKAFWPDETRLVISISMQFEAGGQPPKGTDSPFPRVDFPVTTENSIGVTGRAESGSCRRPWLSG
jgi:hypothetical protein